MTEIRAICNLSDEDLEARRAQLREGLVSKARGREELSDGLALRFDATPELREELDAFISFERKCCPGLDFSVRDESGALRLEIRMPVVVDRVDDEIARAYGALPDRLYLIGKGGQVAFQGAPGPFGFLPPELETAIEAELERIGSS